MAKTARVKGNRMLGNGAAPDFLGGFGKPGEGLCVFGKGWRDGRGRRARTIFRLATFSGFDFSVLTGMVGLAFVA